MPGHEIVGRIDLGHGVTSLTLGQRVGIPWLGHTCGRCPYCLSGRENLCDRRPSPAIRATAGLPRPSLPMRIIVFALGEGGEDASLAPLLCAGLIGWRSLVMAGGGRTLGLYGFGAAAHIIAQVARHQGSRSLPSRRRAIGDATIRACAGRSLGRRLGEIAPEKLDAAIIYAPVGALVPIALGSVRKGGRVVCAGIHMTDIPAFPYDLLWEERELISVANLTRRDGEEFLDLAARIGIKTHTSVFRCGRPTKSCRSCGRADHRRRRTAAMSDRSRGNRR